MITQSKVIQKLQQYNVYSNQDHSNKASTCRVWCYGLYLPLSFTSCIYLLVLSFVFTCFFFTFSVTGCIHFLCIMLYPFFVLHGVSTFCVTGCIHFRCYRLYSLSVTGCIHFLRYMLYPFSVLQVVSTFCVTGKRYLLSMLQVVFPFYVTGCILFSVLQVVSTQI